MEKGIPLRVGRVVFTREEADDFAARLLSGECTEAELASAAEVSEQDVIQWRLKFDPYTEEEKARYVEIVDKVGYGACKKIAATLGVSVHTIYGWRRRGGETKGPPRNVTGRGNNYPEEMRERALADLRRGSTRAEVAASMKIHPLTLTRWAKAAGVVLRNGRPPVSERDRAIIMADAKRLGPAAASEQHGVSLASIYSWLQKKTSLTIE